MKPDILKTERPVLFWIATVIWAAITAIPLSVVVNLLLASVGLFGPEETLGIALGFSVVVCLGWFGTRRGLYLPIP